MVALCQAPASAQAPNPTAAQVANARAGANLQAIKAFSYSKGYRLASTDGGVMLPKTTLVIR